MQTFADQAVIAISNVGLFNEVQQRTRDLSEALQQQTATSEVLRVISSSSGDLQPVFKVMLDNALKICEASYGNMLLWNADGFEAAELHNSPPAFADLFKGRRLVPPAATALGRVVATKQNVWVDAVEKGKGSLMPAADRYLPRDLLGPANGIGTDRPHVALLSDCFSNETVSTRSGIAQKDASARTE